MIREQVKTIKLLEQIARDAGEEILKIYHDPNQNWEISGKADNTPLTIADQRANTIICKALKKNFPDIPIISEENKEVLYEDRKDHKQFWLVDPLDGTKEFIKRNGEFTVNIALVEDSKPISGVVYTPVLDELFIAEKGKGAFRIKAGKKEILNVAEFSENDEQLKVVCSRSHLNDDTQNFLRKYRQPQQVSMGSSLKFMLLAQGFAHVYPRLFPTMEWDTAASQIILEEAGGEVIDWITGMPVIYNKKSLRNNNFVAYGKRKSTI